MREKQIFSFFFPLELIVQSDWCYNIKNEIDVFSLQTTLFTANTVFTTLCVSVTPFYELGYQNSAKIKNETLRIFYHLEMLFEINLTYSYCSVLRYTELPLDGHLKNHAPLKARARVFNAIYIIVLHVTMW